MCLEQSLNELGIIKLNALVIQIINSRKSKNILQEMTITIIDFALSWKHMCTASNKGIWHSNTKYAI